MSLDRTEKHPTTPSPNTQIHTHLIITSDIYIYNHKKRELLTFIFISN